jgi:hypothetical protein
LQYTDHSGYTYCAVWSMTGKSHISFIPLLTVLAPCQPEFLHHHRTKMPRGKHFDVVEKSKIMAWYFEEVPAKGIAAHLNRNVSAVFKIIRENKDLPITSPPTLPKDQGVPGTTATFRRIALGVTCSVIRLKRPNN